VAECEGLPAAEINTYFSPNIFRILREPVKSMICDLRSQQVRDTCFFLSKLSSVCGDHIKGYLREIFGSILDALKVPNKVMSGFVDDCINNMIRNATFKMCIPMIVAEIKESKAKHVRERCIDYINLMMEHWDLTEKDGDLILDAIRTGLEDASVRSRENARYGYLRFRMIYPRRAEKLKASVPNALRGRLLKMEEAQDKTQGEYEDLGKNRRMSHVDEAVTSIQALMRGALTRRYSAAGPYLDEENMMNSSNGSPRNGSSTKTDLYHQSNSLQYHNNEEAPTDIRLGLRAIIGDAKRSPVIYGTVRFVGLTHFSHGYWVGLELESRIGKNDGSVQGQKYFSCKTDYGIFVRPNQVKILNGTHTSIIEPSFDATKALGYLKVKLSHALDLLNQQLEIAEQLDDAVSRKSINENDEELCDLFEEARNLNLRETQLCSDFQTEIDKLYS